MDKHLSRVLAWGIEQLSQAPTDTPELDAQLLLLAATQTQGISKIDFYKNQELIVSDSNVVVFENYIKRRTTGEPVALILKHQAFWTLDLQVSEDTLVPRPETELLIEIILEKCPLQEVSVLDLGTGSGAIALALACERPHWSVMATDIYPKTLEMAKQNAILHNLNHVVFKLGAWFEAVPDERFLVIVSNPPYIDPQDHHLEHPSLSFEPKRALISENKGLQDIAHIIQKAPLFLKKGGLLVLEHGYDQKIAVQGLFRKAGFVQIETRLDLAGLDRATLGIYEA